LDTIAPVIREARDHGAYRCAPRELALAEANLRFARIELDQGDVSRANQHADKAAYYADRARQLSPAERCTAQESADWASRRETTVVTPPPVVALPQPPAVVDPDGDGIADSADKCPTDPEDKDGFEDDDGCPDADDDNDKIPDIRDRCPREAAPGTPDGCPQKYKLIVVTQDKIELKQTIYFAFKKSKILKRSFPLLSEVADVLNTRLSVKLRIEGHTDSRGGDAYNLRLSQARATAVRDWLIDSGVASERLEAAGFGETQPIASNRTAVGREKNRRVEFFITQQ
jgi:outer membrane protein OmpA-like peptidoglycan-associated protein